MKMHARFRLIETTRTMCSIYKEGKYESVEGLRVRMSPSHKEPFGVATPSGELTMLIASPDAIDMYKEAKLDQEYDFIVSPVENG